MLQMGNQVGNIPDTASDLHIHSNTVPHRHCLHQSCGSTTSDRKTKKSPFAALRCKVDPSGPNSYGATPAHGAKRSCNGYVDANIVAEALEQVSFSNKTHDCTHKHKAECEVST